MLLQTWMSNFWSDSNPWFVVAANNIDHQTDDKYTFKKGTYRNKTYVTRECQRDQNDWYVNFLNTSYNADLVSLSLTFFKHWQHILNICSWQIRTWQIRHKHHLNNKLFKFEKCAVFPFKTAAVRWWELSDIISLSLWYINWRGIVVVVDRFDTSSQSEVHTERAAAR